MLLLLFILLCIFLINFIFLDLPVHFYSGRKAELEAWQRIRRKSTIFYLISIICCLQHWNIMLICSWKKSKTKFLLFLSFCNSKTSTMTRNAPRRKNWVFFLKMIFLPWHILSYSKPSICHLNKSHFPHSLKEFERRNIIIFTVTTTLVLYITNFSWSWQGQVTGENEEILLPEPFPGTKISCQVNLLYVTPTMVMVILFSESSWGK